MKEFLGFDLVEVLQTGFAGVAILLMYMAYRLMDETMKSEQDIERLKVKRTSIFGFMVFSTLVMAGSLFIFISQLNKQAISVDVAVLPENKNTIEMMRLTFAGRPVKVTEEGGAKNISISADDVVTVNFDKLTNKMDKLHSTVALSSDKLSQVIEDRDKFKVQNANLITTLNQFMVPTVQTALGESEINITDELIELEAGE